MLPSRPPSFTRRGLPKWTIESLPDDRKRLNLEAQYRKPWTVCSHCGAPDARYCCARCGGCESKDKQRYCSRECQKAHWPEHRGQCELNLKNQDVLIQECSPEVFPGFCRWIRLTTRCSLALQKGRVVEWVARQAYLWSNLVSDTTCLNIELEDWAPESPFTPLVPVRFEIKPANWHKGDNPPPPIKETQPVGQYTFTAYNRVLAAGQFYFSDLAQCSALGPLCPQWPWIFAHCTVMGDIDHAIARTRLEVLVQTAQRTPQAAPLFNQFFAPKFTDGFDFSRAEVNRWLQVMYPVVSSLRSRFHPPSNIISETYGHLK